MAKMSGKAGTAVFGTGMTTAQLGITSWSLEYTCDTADVTAMQSSGWTKEHVATFTDWTATVEGVWVSGLGSVIGTTAALTLEVVSGTAILSAQNAICTGVSFSVGKDDAVTASLTFQGGAYVAA